MISDLVIKPNRLFNFIYDGIVAYCHRYGLKQVPVSYGTKYDESDLEFNIFEPTIRIAPDYSIRLKRFYPKEKVWHILEGIGHELKHYEQYNELKRKGIQPISREQFPETVAKNAGVNYANENINKYTKEELNPISNPIESYITKGNMITSDPRYKGYFIVATGYMVRQCKN